MSRGARVTHIHRDELGSNAQRRHLIIQRPDGSTYSADVPEDFDLGEILQADEVVAFDSYAEKR
jgi:hypothetical protein